MRASLHRHWKDAANVLAVTAFVLLISQRWTGLDTPDSSFYASLGLFTDHVTDRAVFTSYYWTRLGDIVPVHVLTTVAGTWPGLALYRAGLLLIIVSSVYVALRRFTCRPTAAFLALITSLSTVILGYLGNPYLTGTIMAGTTLLLACAMFDSRPAAALSGVGLGWLVMVHPVGVLLAGVTWLVVRLQARTRPGYLALAAGTTVATFVAFVLVGRVVFPRMDWLRTYLDSNAAMTYSDFASRDAIWLRDISLIVPAVILLICVVAWVTHRDEVAAQRALVISSASVSFMLAFSPLMGGVPLEAPMYQAMLWPPALVSLALVMTLALPVDGWTRLQAVTGGLAVVLVAATGFLAPALTLWMGWLLAAALTAVFLFASYKGAIGAIAAVGLLLAGAQLLQNSRGDLGLYYLSPYSNAFNPNPVSEKLHTAVNAQEWLLSRTTGDDRIMNWVGGDWVGGDRELYVVAAMQLWGENRVTLEPEMTPDDVARLDQLRPTTLQLVAPTMDRVLAFWSSLPADLRASPPECYDFTWPDDEITQGHSCLTRLTWPAS